jgi:hypothetical protein
LRDPCLEDISEEVRATKFGESLRLLDPWGFLNGNAKQTRHGPPEAKNKVIRISKTFQKVTSKIAFGSDAG